MNDWLLSSPHVLVEAAVKAVLMYAVALIGLRFAHRRALSQWTAIDFAAAVAIGATVGRTAVATRSTPAKRRASECSVERVGIMDTCASPPPMQW